MKRTTILQARSLFLVSKAKNQCHPESPAFYGSKDLNVRYK